MKRYLNSKLNLKQPTGHLASSTKLEQENLSGIIETCAVDTFGIGGKKVEQDSKITEWVLKSKSRKYNSFIFEGIAIQKP